MRLQAVPVILALAALGTGVLHAGTNSFVVPDFRGQAGSTFNGWESFHVPVGSPGNTADMAGSSGNATLLQFAAGAQVLGSGNLYNGADKSQFEIRYSGTEPVGQVVLQIRALGTELKYDDVRLVAWTVSQAGAFTSLERVPLPGPLPPAPGSGYSASSLWQWDISSLNANSFAVSFGAAEANLSLDSATLDVRAVPEPGAMSLLGLGLGAGWLVRRWRR